MPPILPGSADAGNKFEDLSGIDTSLHRNPYDALIQACENDPKLIEDRYATHRTTRNSQQKAKLLSPEFSGLTIDTILKRLEEPALEPGFSDPRHCLVFWARPAPHVRDIASEIQKKLLKMAPQLWLMPAERMHLTALEVTHSLTDPEIKAIIAAIGAEAISKMTNYTYTHRARLIKPMVSFDGSALALSFLPTSGHIVSEDGSADTSTAFTYHHLRRDLFNIAEATGVSIDSRYVVPSSHITLARFLVQEEHDTPAKMKTFMEGIESINAWLEKEFWPVRGSEKGFEWMVGEGQGLDCREGQLWYGGGSTVNLGKGF